MHQTKPLQSHIQSSDAHLRKLLAKLHKVDSHIHKLTSHRNDTFNTITEAKMQLAELRPQTQREIRGVRPPTFMPHSHITRLLRRLATSREPNRPSRHGVHRHQCGSSSWHD